MLCKNTLLRRFFHLSASLCFFSTITPCLAGGETSPTPLLLAAGSASSDEFRAYAEANNRLTLSEIFDNTRPGTDLTRRLQNMTLKAQEAWLNGSVDESRRLFAQIADMTLEGDWRAAQREAIHYALLRLAQASSSTNERQSWLERAVTSFPDLDIDAKLFPPPLIESFQTIRSRILSETTVINAHSFPNHRWILINGRRFELHENLQLRLPDGLHRVTLISDSQRAFSRTLTPAQLRVLSVPTEPFVEGNCETPDWKPMSGSIGINGIQTVDVWFRNDCVRLHETTGWRPLASDEVDLERFTKGISNPLKPSQAEVRLPWPQNEPPHNLKESNKKHWMWVGVAALATGAAYLLQKELNRESGSGPAAPPPAPPAVKPSHHQGL